MRFSAIPFAIAAAILSSPAMAQTAPEVPRLGPGDKVEISVFARPELSRAYRVRSDGTVTLHVVGEIPAEGLTEAAFEAEVEQALAASFGTEISATVEVSAWRPVIVAGAVATPGAVDYGFGLDVRSAIALAGGTGSDTRLADETGTVRMRVQQEVATIKQIEVRLASLLAERARLRAVISEAGLPDADDGIRRLAGSETAQTFLDAQDVLAASSDRVDDLIIASHEAQEVLATEETAAFEARQQAVESQIELTREALADQETLLERGLARSSNLLDLRLNIDRLRADDLEAVGMAAAARQKIDRAIASQNLTEANRIKDAAARLAELETEIAEMREMLAGSRRFVREFGGDELLRETSQGPSDFIYTLHRRTGEEDPVIRPATPDMALLPGDVLSVAVVTTNEDF